MPNRDGTGPQWGGGPKAGKRHGECGNASKSSPLEQSNKSQSIMSIIGSAITLVSSVVKFFSSKDKDAK